MYTQSDQSTTPSKKYKKKQKITKKKKEKIEKPNGIEKSPLQILFELVSFTQMVVLWVLIGILKKKGNINHPWVYPSINLGIWVFFTFFSIFPRFACYFVKITKNNAMKQYYVFVNFSIYLRILVGLFMYFLFITDITNIEYNDGMIFIVVLIGFVMIFPLFPYYIYYSLHYKYVENHYYDEEDYYELTTYQKQQKRMNRKNKPINEDELYQSHLLEYDQQANYNQIYGESTFNHNQMQQKDPNFLNYQPPFQQQIKQNYNPNQQFPFMSNVNQPNQYQMISNSQNQKYGQQFPIQNQNALIESQYVYDNNQNQMILPVSHINSQNYMNKGVPNPFISSQAQTTSKKNKQDPLQKRQQFKENMRNFSNSIDLTNNKENQLYSNEINQQTNGYLQNQINGQQSYHIEPPQKKKKKKRVF